MTLTLEDLRAARDAAVRQWAEAAGDGSLCRPTGTPTERLALKRREGAATALRQAVRRSEKDGLTPADAVARTLAEWAGRAASAPGDEWRAYAEGGRDALDAIQVAHQPPVGHDS